MAVRGKTIQLYLMDGVADGRIKTSISGWNGVAYKIPRDNLSLCRERDHLSQSGVYFLFGRPTFSHNAPVYIGQASVRKNGDGILARLFEHDKNPEKDYWTDAIVFTTSDDSFGPTELSFLENYFCALANKAGRYTVKNANEPMIGNIKEEKRSELEDYADYADLILGVLGYNVFKPLEEHEKTINISKDTPAKSELIVPNITDSQKRIPELPSTSLPIGQFVKTAMNNLSSSGYVFSNDEIDMMCTPEWSQAIFNTIKPFMRRYIQGVTTTKDVNGYVRFWATPFTFGSVTVLISKEWYERHYESFINWYNSLK